MTQTETYRGLAKDEPVLRLAEADEPIVFLDRPVTGPKAWTRDSVAPGEWVVPLTPAAVAELRAVVSRLREAPLPLLLLTPGQFSLAESARCMAKVKEHLVAGMGLAVVDGLPMDEWTDEESVAVYWLLGQFLAAPVATKWDGTMTYHVTDTGKRFGYGVRGSATNVELSFHTDNAFGSTLPDYVGLLCIRPAATGGISRFCSLYSVHNRMLAEHPDLLRRLYEPAYYDRQAEHAPGAPKVMRARMFRYDGEKLHARLVPGLIRRGYDMVDEPMDARLAEALDALAQTIADPSLWVEFTIERGQLQYLNNLECAHFRSSFTDHPDPARKRHLIRVWHREHGARTYDG
ncbi:TauD/TfdA family dioxygenase [Amycolatopsis silviterrae]|uniref:TauD/TfdA family dioxygenase n=1 Tax=Amycolatopsis silviterrae TaxID=1656914 RepID=A0ABW5HLY5_9PSEU